MRFSDTVIKKPATAFTLIELLVVIAIIAMLMAILMPSLKRIHEHAKRAICLHHLKQLTLGWTMYADANDDKIVCGDTGEYPSRHINETPWVLKDWHADATLAEKENAIRNGALFPYAKDVDLYKCPTGIRGELRSYAVVDAMNCRGWDSHRVNIKRRLAIRHPHIRIVFLDDGGASKAHMGGWTQYHDHSQWWDPPPVRHGDGTDFSFADGHSEYHKWRDPDTLEHGIIGEAFPPEDPDNVDIYWAQVACWGASALTWSPF